MNKKCFGPEVPYAIIIQACTDLQLIPEGSESVKKVIDRSDKP